MWSTEYVLWMYVPLISFPLSAWEITHLSNKKKKKEVAQLNRWTEDRIRWPCLVLNGDEACVCNKKHNKSPSQMNDDIVYRKKKNKQR